MSLKIVSSGNILEDYTKFFEEIVKKCNIKDKEIFHKEFMEFLGKNIKADYSDEKVLEKEVFKNPEKLEEITKEFFTLIDKNSNGFDFYEGATTEIKEIKKLAKEKENAKS